MAERNGVAVGGPLNRVKLSASDSWNGRIERDLSGMYRWNPLLDRWEWKPLEKSLTPRTGRPHRSHKSPTRA